MIYFLELQDISHAYRLFSNMKKIKRLPFFIPIQPSFLSFFLSPRVLLDCLGT